MNTESSPSPDREKKVDLGEKFPDLKPAKPPTLYTVNGIGTRMGGWRDADEETGTYVKTQCLSVLFVPVLWLRAFRVADAPGGRGWYFLGRESLSAFEKAWNTMVLAGVLAALGWFGWSAYRDSPDGIALRRLDQAAAHAASGRTPEAVRIYASMMRTFSRRSQQAKDALGRLLDEKFQRLGTAEAAEVVRILSEGWGPERPPADPRLAERVLALAEAREKDDPAGSLRLLESHEFTPEMDPAAARERLLRACLEKAPGDAELTSKLAAVLEKRGELEACEALLAPLGPKLGSTEGARILGQTWARKGRVEEARPILESYCADRLEKLHAAEKEYRDSASRAWDAGVKRLEEGSAPGFDYREYEASDKAARESMVTVYLQGQVAKDAPVEAKLANLTSASRVVPVALDLGIVRLRRAQEIQDADARRKELEEAEKVFLAIRGAAGETDEFRLFYGQVSYWLGKAEEGKRLFDELLESKKREAGSLLSVAHALRAVGEETDARKLTEEAYQKAADDAGRYAAARVRSLLHVDQEDQIVWLRRSNPADPVTVAALEHALGEKALAEGKEDEAVPHLRRALEAQSRLPRGSAVLNNSALIHSTLFSATGDREELKGAIASLEEALALDPGDVHLLGNVSQATLEGVVADLVGEAVDFRTLKVRPELDLLAYLYADAAGSRTLADRFRSKEALKRVVGHLERLLVLAPRADRASRLLTGIHAVTRDLAALRALRDRLRERPPDVADGLRVAAEWYAGKKDGETRVQVEGNLAKFDRLLKSIASDRQPLNYAIAGSSWLQYWRSTRSLGMELDADRAVSLAEEIHRAAPSAETRSDLISALLIRFSSRSAGKDPGFAEMASRARRSLSFSSIVAAALPRSPALRAAFAEDADARRALDLIRQTIRAFPERPRPEHWAILLAVAPAEAGPVAAALRGDEVGRTLLEIGLILGPTSASTAFEESWRHEAEGHPDQAREALRRVAALGVPLPFDP